MKFIEKKLNSGFTIAEILVVMTIVAIVGTMMVAIFTNTLRGSNKSQMLSSIKQNGQAVLENLDKTIRGADDIICISVSQDTLALEKDGLYTRFKFTPPASNANGMIQQDSQVLPAVGDINVFINNLCSDPLVNPIILTDTNTQTGVSVSNGLFTQNKLSGYKDIVTVSFTLGLGVGVPAGAMGQVDPVTFQTTIQLR